MAKEGVEQAEETEQMIEKEAGKEPAEGGGGGPHRLGDAQEMRAVVLAGFGGLNKLRVTRRAMPEPQDGELKIRIKAWSSIRSFLLFLGLFCARGKGAREPRGARGCVWGGVSPRLSAARGCGGRRGGPASLQVSFRGSPEVMVSAPEGRARAPVLRERFLSGQDWGCPEWAGEGR